MFVEHDRRSIRLRGHDYSGAGAYFVTICALEGAHLFGNVRDGVMEPNQFGQIVLDEWRRTATIRSYVNLGEFVLMPNHVHGIIWIVDHGLNGADVIRRGKARLAPTGKNTPMKFGEPPSRSIPSIIGSFKSASTKRIREIKPEWPQIWQRNYYDRIIRDHHELFAIRKYIRDNPANWERDEYR